MKSQWARIIALSATIAMMASTSTARGQFHAMGHPPGHHPAALPYAVMMGQEHYDPTWVGTSNYGDTCCGPNWYDAFVEGVYMTREDVGSDTPFSSDGIAGAGAPNIVLSGDDIDSNFEPGMRAFVRYQLNAVYNVEGGYLGVVHWDTFASASSPNHSLYSAFSQFGNVPFGGFADVDQATLHRVDLRADLDSVEINMRRSWIGPRYRLWGSWLTGVRYVKWREKFLFFADVRPHVDPIGGGIRGPAQTNYRIITDNDLIGLQIGGELGVCIIPGLNLVGEAKGGVYGNSAEQETEISSTTIDPALTETADSEDVAFVGEAGVYLIEQFHPLFKIRAGYQLLFMDGLALATENFNSQPPFLGGPRAVTVNDRGDTFVHGGVVGLEIGW